MDEPLADAVVPLLHGQGWGFRVMAVCRDWALARWALVPSSPMGPPLVPLSPWFWVAPLGAARLEVVGWAALVAVLPPGQRRGVWVGKLGAVGHFVVVWVVPILERAWRPPGRRTGRSRVPRLRRPRGRSRWREPHTRRPGWRAGRCTAGPPCHPRLPGLGPPPGRALPRPCRPTGARGCGCWSPRGLGWGE